MTFGFALMTAGTLLMYSGYTNTSVSEVMRGLAQRRSGPGDAGFLTVLARNSVNGMAGAVTPGSGGTGPVIKGRAPAGLTTFDGKPVCKWVARELQWARKRGWSGTLTSGYRSVADQARVCAEVPPGTPCATPGESNHQGKRYPKCAADVTEPQELDAVLSKKPGRRLKYTGPGANDEPHFSSGLTGI